MGERQGAGANGAARTFAVFVLVNFGVLRVVDDTYPGRVGLVFGRGKVVGMGQKLAACEQRQCKQAEQRAYRHEAFPFAESGLQTAKEEAHCVKAENFVAESSRRYRFQPVATGRNRPKVVIPERPSTKKSGYSAGGARGSRRIAWIWLGLGEELNS